VQPEQVLLATSTPSEFLQATAAEFGLAYLVNVESRGIASDWNFCLGLTECELLTIAHQDDVYHPDYCERMLLRMREHPNATIGFCNSSEHDATGPRTSTLNLFVKRWLTHRVFRDKNAVAEMASKRRLLAFGNPICCPSVVFNRAALRGFCFQDRFKSNLDWYAWYELANRDGDFVYEALPLASKRAHRLSETSVLLDNRTREKEDRIMFALFWPKPVAALLAFFYRLGYLANRV